MITSDASGAVVRYPDCVVQLSGVDGNIFNVIAHARFALTSYLTQEGIMPPPEARSQASTMTSEIMASESYESALAVIFRWMSVE